MRYSLGTCICIASDVDSFHFTDHNLPETFFELKHVCGWVLCVFSTHTRACERRGKRYEKRGVKREVVILPGLVPETLVKLPCGLIIINREGWHDLRYKLSAALNCRCIGISAYFSSFAGANLPERSSSFLVESRVNREKGELNSIDLPCVYTSLCTRKNDMSYIFSIWRKKEIRARPNCNLRKTSLP